MQSLSQILIKKDFLKQNTSKRKGNIRYEEAREFGEYVGLNTIFVLKLFRDFGRERVLSLRSWLKDIPYDDSKGGLPALIVWKLKQKKI